MLEAALPKHAGVRVSVKYSSRFEKIFLVVNKKWNWLSVLGWPAPAASSMLSSAWFPQLAALFLFFGSGAWLARGSLWQSVSHEESWINPVSRIPPFLVIDCYAHSILFPRQGKSNGRFTGSSRLSPLMGSINNEDRVFGIRGEPVGSIPGLLRRSGAFIDRLNNLQFTLRNALDCTWWKRDGNRNGRKTSSVSWAGFLPSPFPGKRTACAYVKRGVLFRGC